MTEELKREIECLARMNGQCLWLNRKVGWSVPLPLPACDECFKHGGLPSESSDRHLDLIAGGILGSVEKNGPHLYRRDVLVNLTLNRQTVQARKEFLETIKDGAEMTRMKWFPVKDTWEAAASFIKAMASRGITSMKVAPHVKAQRIQSCFGTNPEGVKVDEPCPSLTTSRDGTYFLCGACSCGDTSLAKISPENTGGSEPYSKLDYPYLECPRKRPGFSNESPVVQPVR